MQINPDLSNYSISFICLCLVSIVSIHADQSRQDKGVFTIQLGCNVSIVSIHADQSRLRGDRVNLNTSNHVSIVSIHADQSRQVVFCLNSGEYYERFQSYQFMQINPDKMKKLKKRRKKMLFQSYQFRQINPDLCIYQSALYRRL